MTTQTIIQPNGQVQTVQVIDNRNGTTSIIDRKGNILIVLKQSHKNKQKEGK